MVGLTVMNFSKLSTGVSVNRRFINFSKLNLGKASSSCISGRIAVGHKFTTFKIIAIFEYTGATYWCKKRDKISQRSSTELWYIFFLFINMFLCVSFFPQKINWILTIIYTVSNFLNNIRDIVIIINHDTKNRCITVCFHTTIPAFCWVF